MGGSKPEHGEGFRPAPNAPSARAALIAQSASRQQTARTAGGEYNDAQHLCEPLVDRGGSGIGADRRCRAINVFAFGVFLKPIAAELGIGRATFSSALSLHATTAVDVSGVRLDDCPSFAAPPVTIRWLLMGLSGSGMSRSDVTWS
jgi:hypothetical protein